MYEGYQDFGRRRWGRAWKWICALILTAEAAVICLLLAMRALGATGPLNREISGRPGWETGGWAYINRRHGAKSPVLSMGVRLSEEIRASAANARIGPIEMGPGLPFVLLDPGHGGQDEGSNCGDMMEKDINLEIAKRIRDKLLAYGYRVVMTREEDGFVEQGERVELAKRSRADLYVSIKQNIFDELDGRGIQAWDVRGGTEGSGRLARLIWQETIKAAGAGAQGGFSSQEFQEQIASGFARGIHLYFHPKTMYLTFDDGPSEENTSAVLDILKERNIKATFFVVGENVRRHPEVAKRIVQEGHTIGIHCNRHEYNAVYESVDSYMRDFQEAYNAVLEVTGAEIKLFRFPGGSINAYNQEIYQEIIRRMTERGFTYFDWNASLDDSLKLTDPDELIENARASALNRRTVILLAHDIVSTTPLCLNGLIDAFPEYEMKPLTADVEPMQFHDNVLTSSP